MRNFVITVNGKTYEVGVEETGATASAPKTTFVAAAPAAMPVAAATAAPLAAPAPKANVEGG